MLSKYSSAVGGVTRIFMSASQTEMHTLSVVSVLISGKLTDGCMHSRPLAVKRSEFVNGSGAQGQHSVTVCSRASSGGQDPYPQVLLVVRAPRHIVCIESFRIWIWLQVWVVMLHLKVLKALRSLLLMGLR